jgi:hypothetical protein
MQLVVASEHLAISTIRISTLEGDLRAANSSSEASVAKVTKPEATLGNTQKLLEAAYMEGEKASKD